MSSNTYLVQMTKQQMTIIHRALQKYQQDLVYQEDIGKVRNELEHTDEYAKELMALIEMSDQSPDNDIRPVEGYDPVKGPDGKYSLELTPKDPINGWAL